MAQTFWEARMFDAQNRKRVQIDLVTFSRRVWKIISSKHYLDWTKSHFSSVFWSHRMTMEHEPGGERSGLNVSFPSEILCSEIRRNDSGQRSKFNWGALHNPVQRNLRHFCEVWFLLCGLQEENCLKSLIKHWENTAAKWRYSCVSASNFPVIRLHLRCHFFAWIPVNVYIRTFTAVRNLICWFLLLWFCRFFALSLDSQAHFWPRCCKQWCWI